MGNFKIAPLEVELSWDFLVPILARALPALAFRHSMLQKHPTWLTQEQWVGVNAYPRNKLPRALVIRNTQSFWGNWPNFLPELCGERSILKLPLCKLCAVPSFYRTERGQKGKRTRETGQSCHMSRFSQRDGGLASLNGRYSGGSRNSWAVFQTEVAIASEVSNSSF